MTLRDSENRPHRIRPRSISFSSGNDSENTSGETRGENVKKSRNMQDLSSVIGIVIAIIPAFLALVRILLVARFDPFMIKVLLQTLNVPAIAAESVILWLPVAAGIGGVTIGFWTVYSVQNQDRTTYDLSAWIAIALVMTGITAAFFLPLSWCVSGGGLCFGSAYGLIKDGNRTRDFGPARRKWNKRFQVFVIWFAAVILSIGSVGLVAVRIGQMWLPVEVIEQSKGKQLGYVLHAGDHATTVASFDLRSVEIIQSEEIRSRTLCYKKQPGDEIFLADRSIASMINSTISGSSFRSVIDPTVRSPVVPKCSGLVE